MIDYGKPVAFTLDYAEMSVLFDLLDEALKARKDDDRLKKLEWLRNQLYSYLS